MFKLSTYLLFLAIIWFLNYLLLCTREVNDYDPTVYLVGAFTMFSLFFVVYTAPECNN